MNELQREDAGKHQHEKQLRWQSQLLLTLVLATASTGLLFLSLSARTAATAEGLAVCAAFGLLVWFLHAATPLAAVTGFVLTSCMYLGTVQQPDGSWRQTALLPGLTLFVLAFAATHFRRSQKEQSGLAESRRGRGASQVAANMGIAALAALALLSVRAARLPFHGWTLSAPSHLLPMVAALAEAAADTVSSEIGQALGGRPRLITSWKRVPPGTDGAVTFGGTVAGCLASALPVLVAIPTLHLDPRQAAIAWGAALVGFCCDSVIGATVERRGWLNNDLVNFLSTAVAAWAALAW